MVGTGLTAAFAAIIAFAVLPNSETFAAFSLAIGLVLVPAGAGMAQPWQTAMFTAMAANFVPMLAPANPMSYDTVQFYNAAVAIVAGVGAAAVSFRLIPPLSPAFRTRRLLALTLRDLRRLATGPIPRTPDDWEGRMYGRFSALPDAAQPLQRSQLLAALSVGTEIIQLRRIARRIDLGSELDAALDAVARGDSADRDRPPRPARRGRSLPVRRDRRPPGARQHPCNVGGAYPTCRLLRRRRGRVRFTEINLFGVYVAPISVMMVAAWVITIGLRRFAARFGLLRYVWHPAVFVFAVYMIVLSSIVLVAAR